MSLSVDSLGFALNGVASVLAAVESGTALPAALSKHFAASALPAATRGAIQDLSYRSLRQWACAQTLLELLADRPPTQPQLRTLLLCAIALLCEDPPTYAEHTLVDQAVNACAADPMLVRAKGMVNAVLRRLLRERSALLATARQSEVARWNYPQWWIDQTRAAWPHDWQAILSAGSRHPPLTLRVNQRKASVESVLQVCALRGITAQRIGAMAIRLERPMPILEIPGFSDGWVSVQDAGAQHAGHLLDVQDGMRVLDACAAPGGKTSHLLELADLDLLAIDVDRVRLTRVQENLDRLELKAHLLAADASRREWWDGRLFDRILADLPCTASGIVRRHPDIPWLRRPEDTAKLAALSATLLNNLWGLLKPGGKLLMVTCSLWPQESALQADRFATQVGAIRLAAPGQLLPSSEPDHDGLFYALLQKPSV